MMGSVIALWVVLGVIAIGLALRERRDRLDDILAGPTRLAGPSLCRCQCGQTFPVDQLEWHLISEHPESEPSDR